MTHIPRLSRRAFTAGALSTVTLGKGALAQVAETPESPIGPFYPSSYRGETDADFTRLAGHAQRAAGQVIEVMGRVLDARGNPIVGAQLDIWQANTHGRYAHPQDPAVMPLDPHFQGFGRITTGSDGSWHLTTVKPGSYDSPVGWRTPHIHMDVTGFDSRKIVQMYFPEEEEMNARDDLLRALGSAAPASIASALGDYRYNWDIVLIEG